MLGTGRWWKRCARTARIRRVVWQGALWASASMLGAACCAQQTVQAPWTPTHLPNLQLWLDASDANTFSFSADSYVFQWRDKSPHGRHATQATAANQPLYQSSGFNGLGTVAFDGSNDFMNLTQFAQANANDLFIAVDTTRMGAGWRIILNRAHASDPAPYISTSGADYRPSVYVHSAGRGYALQPSSVRRKALLRWGFAVSGTPTVWTQLDAGPELIQASATYTLGNWNTLTSTLGSQMAGMDLSEVILTSSLASADRQRLEGYLAHKWGLVDNLPADHPYKTAAPLAEVAPLVHWKLDETSGTTFANSGTLGTAANASLSGAATVGSASLPVDGGKAVRLANAQLTAGAATELVGADGNFAYQTRTVEGWFRVDSSAGEQCLYSEGDAARGAAIYLQDGVLRMVAYNQADSGSGVPWGNAGGSGVLPVAIAAAEPIRPGVTYHVAMVIDGDFETSGTLTGYLNGVAFGTESGVGASYGTRPVVVGRFDGVRDAQDTVRYDAPLAGVVDDVKIWDEALPASYFADVYRTQWGLVGHWKFDEESGTTASDSSGLGNHGTLINGPVFTAGKRGNAVLFDGANDYVTANVPITPSFSVALWGKSTTATWNHYGWLASARSANGFIVHPWPSTKSLSFYIVNSSAQYQSPLTATIQDITVWRHYAMTWDAGSRMFRAYVDGVLVREAQYGSIPRGSSRLNVFFGRDDYGGRYGAGMVDDVRIYTRAITDAEIAKLAEASELLAHWPLDETSGTTAYDISGNGRHATYVAVQLADDAPHPAAGAAPRFDGVASYVELPTLDADLSQGYSVALWAKPTAISVYERMIQITEPNQENGLLMVRALNGSWFLAVRDKAAVQWNVLETSSVSLQNHRWEHFVATVDAAGQAILYRNGQQVASGSVAPLSNGARSFCYIGAGYSDLSRKWTGNIADVRLYAHPLSPREVSEIYGLVGWYRCEEASGSAAADSSGQDNHAVVVGSAQWSTGLKEGSGALRLDGNSYLRIDQIPLEGPHAAIAGWAKIEAVDGAAADLANLGEHLVLRLDEAAEGRGTTALGYSGAGYGMASSQRFYEAAGWRHYAAVLDGATGQVTLHLDGVKLATATAATGLTFRELVNQVTFGAATNGASDYRLKGWVDDLRIYNRPLSKAELRTLYFGRFNPGPRIIEWREVE